MGKIFRSRSITAVLLIFDLFGIQFHSMIIWASISISDHISYIIVRVQFPKPEFIILRHPTSGYWVLSTSVHKIVSFINQKVK